MPRDYYEILGVQRGASADDIRKAHRRLARKYHPDVNKETDAAERFAEVQEAYDVLSEPEKRKRYDQFGHAGVGGATGPGEGPFRGSAGGAGPFGGGFRTTWSAGDGPEWNEVDASDFESVFGDLFGARRARGRGGARQAPKVGEDVEHQLSVPFAVAASGGTETLRLTGGDGSTQSLDVRIPAGIRSGTKLRVKGKGHVGRGGGPPGDLILVVTVGEHPWFRRDGLDLYLDVPITIAEAALGTVIEVPLLKGSVKLRVPQGTSSGAKLRAKGKGLVDAKGETGDFYAVIRIVAPESLSEPNLKALERIAASLPNPRDAMPWASHLEE